MIKEYIKVQLNELIPHARNPRKNDSAVEAVSKSIKETGYITPIIVDEKNEILCGHTRAKSLKKLGHSEVEVLKVTGLTDEQKKRYRILDNKTGEVAEWDFEILQEDFKLDELVDLGFDIKDLDQGEVIEDEAPPIPETPKTVKGDVYELGSNRVMCGDSTIITDVEKLMDGKKAELLFTSPPYSDIREYNGNKELDVNKISEFIQTYYDFAEYQVVNLGIKRQEHEIVCYWDNYIQNAKKCGYKLLSWNVWCKQNAGSVGNQSAFFPIAHEWIFVFGKKFKDINRTEQRKTEIKKSNSRSVRQANGDMKYSTLGKQYQLKEMESWQYCVAEMGEIRKKHPATFPIELPAMYINAMTNYSDIVIEPFGGSGTTLIACEQTNRKCYGMELDEKYCDVIVQRWVNFTKQTKIKRNGIDMEWPVSEQNQNK